MLFSRSSRPGQALVVYLGLVAVIVTGVARLSSAEPVDRATAKLVAELVPQYHINRPSVDDAASSLMLETYLKDLDQHGPLSELLA